MKKISIYMLLSILISISIFLLSCGSVDKPYQPAEVHSDIAATIKIMGTAFDEYTTVFGTNMTAADTANPLLISEDAYATVSGDSPLLDYIVKTTDVNVYYCGAPPGYPGRYLPNVGVRTGEEPMMNLITDAMLYYARKNYSNANSQSPVYGDEYLKRMRIAGHNGGGMNVTRGADNPIAKTALAVDQTAQTIKDLFRFDNNISVVRLTSQSLKNLLEYSLGQIKYRNGDPTAGAEAYVSDGNFIHWSGLAYTYDRGDNSSADNAYYHDGTSIVNPGSRVKDVYLMKVPYYDEVNDQYDAVGLKAALDDAHDSVQIVANGVVTEDTEIYTVLVNFLLFQEKAAYQAMGLSGEVTDENILFNDMTSRPNEAIDAILSDENYTLYHRLQGRIRAIELAD